MSKHNVIKAFGCYINDVLVMYKIGDIFNSKDVDADMFLALKNQCNFEVPTPKAEQKPNPPVTLEPTPVITPKPIVALQEPEVIKTTPIIPQGKDNISDPKIINSDKDLSQAIED